MTIESCTWIDFICMVQHRDWRVHTPWLKSAHMLWNDGFWRTTSCSLTPINRRSCLSAQRLSFRRRIISVVSMLLMPCLLPRFEEIEIAWCCARQSSGGKSVQLPHLGAATFLSSVDWEYCAHTCMQYCDVKTGLLQCSATWRATEICRIVTTCPEQSRSVVLQKPRTVHATPLLKSLHWLPVDQRIRYKLILMTYKANVLKTLDYLHKLLSNRTTSSSMSLRSSSRTLLCPKLTRTNYGDRAFSALAPVIWNDLPANFNFSDNLNIFKKRLKTFLFNRAYNWLSWSRKWSSMSLYLRTLWHVK